MYPVSNILLGRQSGIMETMKTSVISILAVFVIGAAAYIGFLHYASPLAETNDTGSQGKLNINGICEGALAYMTFPSGAAAEVWVQECKEGKHPEAVDQYKIQMGITDDRAI